MIRRPPRSTLSSSSAASDVYKRQEQTLRWRAKKFRLRRPPRRADSTHSPEQFLPVPDVVAEHERREIGGGGVVRPAPRDLRERVDEVHERGVRRDHERRELDAVAPQLLGLFERAVHDLQVEAERVLVEAPALVDARRLAVRNHENLAVARAAPHEKLPRDAEPGLRVRVERPDLRLAQLLEGDGSCLVAEEHDVDRVLRVFLEDQLRQRERDLLRGREAVFAVEDHRVRDVDRDRGRAGALVLDVEDLEVVRPEREVVRVAPRGVRHRANAIEAGDVVAELPRARLGQRLRAGARTRDGVQARSRFLKRGEDLFERVAADAALAGAEEHEVPLAVAADDALLLERGAERLEVDVLADDPAALQLLHPLHRLLDVAAETRDEVEEELQQLFVRQERLEEIERQLAVPVIHVLMLRQIGKSGRRETSSACVNAIFESRWQSCLTPFPACAATGTGAPRKITSSTSRPGTR